MSISDALKLYYRKFKALKQNRVHILKSPVYFEDAENDEMPLLIRPVEMSNIICFKL